MKPEGEVWPVVNWSVTGPSPDLPTHVDCPWPTCSEIKGSFEVKGNSDNRFAVSVFVLELHFPSEPRVFLEAAARSILEALDDLEAQP